MKSIFLITSIVFGSIAGCKGGSTSFTHNQAQTVNINDPQCVLEEFVSCPMNEVRQFCRQNPDNLIGAREPNCLECPTAPQCPTT